MVTESIPLNREKDGKLYCSALEEDPTVLAGNYEAAYNTMYSGETAEAATVEYSLGSDLVIEKLRLRLCHRDFRKIRSIRICHPSPEACISITMRPGAMTGSS